MDFGTWLGLIIGGGSLFAALRLVDVGGPERLGLSALLLLVGGSLGVLAVSCPLRQALALPRFVAQALRPAALYTRPSEMVQRLVDMAHKCRRKGWLILEEDRLAFADPLWQRGVQLLMDGVDRELLGRALEMEADRTEREDQEGVDLLTVLGQCAPVLGILGTLLGLGLALAHVGTDQEMGSLLARASQATLFGLALAHLICFPLRQKLLAQAAYRQQCYRLVSEGFAGLQVGDPPRRLAERLLAFVPPDDRTALEAHVEALSQPAFPAADEELEPLPATMLKTDLEEPPLLLLPKPRVAR